MLKASFSKSSERTPFPEFNYQGDIDIEEEETVCADCGSRMIFEDEQFSLQELVWHPQKKF